MDKKLEIEDKVFVLIGPIKSFNTKDEANNYVKEAGWTGFSSVKIMECKVDDIKDVTKEFLK